MDKVERAVKNLEAFLDELVDLTYGFLPEDKVEFEWEQAPASLHNKFYITIKVDEDAFEDSW